MSFGWPHLLWLLLAPAALLGWEIAHRRRTGANARPKILQAEAGAHSLRLAAFNPRTPSGAKPRFWLYAGMTLALIAVARPQWGRLEEPVFDQSREILLAIDLSRSMLTPDVRPSRLERAKLLIQSLLEKLAGERVGLLVFSGTAFLQSPLSADYEILREFLPALGPDFLPQGGTNYRALIDAAIGAFGGSASADRFLVILSDGEATEDDWKSRVDELKTKGIRVLGLGVGTAAGAMIPDGAGGLVKDERGAVVLSKLESDTLQQLAQATGGVYRDASAWIDLAGLLQETVEAGRKGRFMEKNTIRLAERFQWPLAFGLWCLLVSFCYEFPVRPRSRDIRLAPPTPENRGQRTENRPSVAGVAVFCLLASVLCPPASVRAAAKIGRPPSALPVAPSVAAPEAAEPSALAKIVGRLSATDHRTARDWAELGRETVTWGSRLESEKQPVPEGPVRDALGAVDLGAKLDPKTADWEKLREELEALLKKPDDQNQDQKDKPDQPDKNQQQDKEQKNQDQNKPDQKQSQDQKDSDPQKSQDQKNQDQDTPPSDNQKPPPSEQRPPGESAFGDMKKKEEPPPPPPEDQQKVGGAQEKKDEQKELIDPALALPLQKLDQLRNQDSPAELFQLMESDKKAAKKPAKDW